MNRISKWKLALIIVVFVFSALYLLPTIPGVYGPFYGYFDIWMQGKIPSPEVSVDEEGTFIKFVIPPKDVLPEGWSVPEAADSIKNIVRKRLTQLKLGKEEIMVKAAPEEQAQAIEGKVETTQEKGSPESVSRFSFRDFTKIDLYLDFTQTKSEAELQDIISKLQSDSDPSVIPNPPELAADQTLGDIRFAVTTDDLSEGKGISEVLADIKNDLIKQLGAETLNMKPVNDFSFNDISQHELHLRFNPQKSESDLKKIIEDLQLYGGLPLALRPIFPDKPLRQGQDLKGGLHIVLELDVRKAIDLYLDNQAKDDIRGRLNSKKISCTVEKALEKSGSYMLIIRPLAKEDSGITEIQYLLDMKNKLVDMGFNAESIEDKLKPSPELIVKMDVEWDITDLIDELQDGHNPLIVTVRVPSLLQGEERDNHIKQAREVLDDLDLFDSPQRLNTEGNSVVFSLQISENSARKLAEDNLDSVMKTLENRINKFGLAESTIRRVSGRPRILIEIPEEQNPAETLAAIKSPGILEFKLVKESPSGGLWYGPEGTTEPSPDEIPSGDEVRQHIDGGWYVLDSEALLYGTDLKGNAATVRRGESGKLEVLMYLKSEGQRKFSELTGANVGKHLAILLDDVIQSAPRITEKISTRSASITGNFTEDQADYLSKILKAGSFPAPTKTAEERIVGPALGEEAIRRGKIAFSIGIAMVIIFMVFYYKWSGTIAVAALLFNFQIILGILGGFGATLTLPGMAGLILTIGMSVDANVLIFERIRDELRSGKTVRSSIDSGYRKAFWTILDANVTTFLTAIVLYEVGTGPVKGFAVTLAIGIMASMFTALVFTREIYSWVLSRKRTVTKLSI